MNKNNGFSGVLRGGFSLFTTLALVLNIASPAVAFAISPHTATVAITSLTDDSGTHTSPFNFSCPDSPLFNPVNISGGGTVTNPVGDISQYHYSIDWGDGSPVTTGNTFSGSDPYSFSFNFGPHNYTTSGNFSVVAQIYHQTSPGHDSTDSQSIPVTICVHVPPPTDGSLTLTKVVDNTAGGNKQVSDFPLMVGITSVISGQVNDFLDGAYAIWETNSPGYTGTFTGDCSKDGYITIIAGHHYDCTLTNTYSAPVNTAPVISLLGANPLSIFVNDPFTDPGATASDTQDGDLTSSIITTGSVDNTTIGAYILTYSVTDLGGLSASTTRTVNVNPTLTQCNDGIDNDDDGLIDAADPACTSPAVNDENSAPTITLNGSNPMDITVGTAFNDPGATANDPEEGALTPVVTGSVDANTVGTYTLTYTATDSHGASVSVTRTVNVNASVPQTFQLTVSTSGEGTGTVTSGDNKINCVSGSEESCTATYNDGDSVTLTATASDGSTFTDTWSGACTGNNPTCTIAMNSTQSANAHFTLSSTTTTTTTTTTTGGGGGSSIPGGHRHDSGSTGGQVLGISIGPDGFLECSDPYLTEYLHIGNKNNPEQVKKLQQFLNAYLQIDLPVTGTFGQMTYDAVMKFQSMNEAAILAPWGNAGLPTGPTGYVYKTTQRWINILKCPTLISSTPIPTLP